MKNCAKCGVAKTTAEFGTHARQLDGLQRNCKKCQREYYAGYRKAKPEVVKGTARRWSENHPDTARLRSAESRSANPERHRKYSADYRERHPDRRREICAKYRKNNTQRERIYRKIYAALNRDKLAAKSSYRRAAKVMATPPWANSEEIREIYGLAMRVTRDSGIPHHVDHIVPLISPIVCGLHCEANLWVMIGSQNQSKSNRYWPDMPD
jgi:hypothetical protein